MHLRVPDSNCPWALKQNGHAFLLLRQSTVNVLSSVGTPGTLCCPAFRVQQLFRISLKTNRVVLLILNIVKSDESDKKVVLDGFIIRNDSILLIGQYYGCSAGLQTIYRMKLHYIFV